MEKALQSNRETNELKSKLSDEQKINSLLDAKFEEQRIQLENEQQNVIEIRKKWSEQVKT